MLALRHHNSHDYAMLPDIDDSDAGILTLADQVCLEEIGHCLLRSNAYSQFGVTLLHSHFPIDDDETFVEEVQVDARWITLRPVRCNPSELFAINVRFDDSVPCEERVRLIGLEFAPKQALAGVSPIGDLDCAILSTIAEILDRQGKTGRFGLRLLHNPLKLNDAILFESCDPVQRLLTCRAGGEDNPDFPRSVPTVFRWDQVQANGSSNGLEVGRECMQFCKYIQRCVRPIHGNHKSSREHTSD
jgi:hypothetical protein